MPALTLYPYLLGPTWVFDDARTGLKEEAFVLGSSEMIHRLVAAKKLPDPGRGFALSFSDEPFNHDVVLTWLGRDDVGGQIVPDQDGAASQMVGNWYAGEISGETMQGWLCPALFLYFSSAPKSIYVKAERLPEEVDPVWRVGRDEPIVRRFVSAESTKEGS